MIYDPASDGLEDIVGDAPICAPPALIVLALLELGFSVARAQRASVDSSVAFEIGVLLGEYQTAIMSRNKRKLVAILPEVKLTFELRGFFGTHKEARIGSAFDVDGGLQSLVNEISQETKETYKVALTGTVRANENVKSS
jgi:hypothetical protein